MLLADRRRIAAERLAAMRIAPPAEPDGSMVDTIARTVHHHLAMQAQDVGSGMWSVGVRTGATRADVEAAIEARLVTRSWPMRGTLHLMATQDVRWMCRLLNERMVATQRRVFEAEGLTEAVVGRARDVLVERPDRGRRAQPARTRSRSSRRNGVDPSGQRAYHLVGRFCQEGLLCQGPAEGRQPTFVLIDEWVPQSWAPDREEAMAALATRYVASHGPVTERDLAGWCNQNLTFAREAVALAGDAVTTETIGGQAYLVAADRPEPAAGHPGPAAARLRRVRPRLQGPVGDPHGRGGAAGGPGQERDVPRHRGRRAASSSAPGTARRAPDATVVTVTPVRVAERDPTPRDRAGGSRLRPTSRESRPR